MLLQPPIEARVCYKLKLRQHLVLNQCVGLIELIWRCRQRLACIFICLIAALDGKGNFLRPITLRLRAAGTEQYEAGQDGGPLHGSSPLSFTVWHRSASVHRSTMALSLNSYFN